MSSIELQGYSGRVNQDPEDSSMRFAVLFEDNDDKAEARARYMADHLVFLEDNGEFILAAGPLLDGEAGAGGLWIVEASGPDAVRHLIESDPFWPTGLRKSVRILKWRRVFEFGDRLI
jgi:uncharacterized protein YciI